MQHFTVSASPLTAPDAFEELPPPPLCPHSFQSLLSPSLLTPISSSVLFSTDLFISTVSNPPYFSDAFFFTKFCDFKLFFKINVKQLTADEKYLWQFVAMEGYAQFCKVIHDQAKFVRLADGSIWRRQSQHNTIYAEFGTVIHGERKNMAPVKR